MPKLDILTIPNPLLKEKAAPVSGITEDLSAFIADLVETLRSFPRCVGVAAPQTGKSVRIVAVDVSAYPKPHPNRGLTVLLNPVITRSEGRQTGREGCLSVPDFTGNVERAEKVWIEGLAPNGEKIVFETAGFEAVVFQHEIDHLDGFLFLDRVKSIKSDIFRRKK